jgi:hypothetical protein
MNPAINNWKQSGLVHFWRYKPEKSGLNGWHFQANVTGLDSVLDLVKILHSAASGKRTLTLTRPSDRMATGPFSPLAGRKVISPTSLQFSVSADSPVDLWQLDESGERAELKLGKESLAELRDGLEQLNSRGYGDFQVGPTRGARGQNIWFW